MNPICSNTKNREKLKAINFSLTMTITNLHTDKLETVAAVAYFIVSAKTDEWDSTISRQMVAEGLRKLHDNGNSFRGTGKYLGHPGWSRNALMLLKENRGVVSGITRSLSHEHVVPINVLLDILFSNKPSTPQRIFESQIRKYSIVAIITREEDSMFRKNNLHNCMPKGWTSRADVWARYKQVDLYKHICFT